MKSRYLGVHVLTWTIVALLLAMPLLLASPTAMGVGRLPANLRIAGVSVGRTRPEDATAMLTGAASQASNRTFTISLLGEEHIFTANEIGLIFDPAATVQATLDSGVSGDVQFIVHLNPDQFQAHLDYLQSLLPNQAQNAEVVINGTKATVVPGENGQNFDSEAYRAQLLDLAYESNPEIALEVTDSEPDISTAEAETTASQVNSFLAAPLVLQAGEGSWEISPETMAAAIIVEPNGSGGLAISWDLDVLKPEIARIVGEIENTDQADAWVQDLGTHSWLVPEKGSMTVDQKGLIESLNATLASGGTTVKVPVQTHAADKSSEDVMAELGITGIIASGDSVYTGSGTGRLHNVETAAFYIDRTLVAPGGTYSFNDSVGSLFTGEYMSAGSYIDGPSGQSIAGGVCQVSTTVFRAALNAGFPIVERWPHSYRSTFYELGGWSPGYDAAIVQDSIIPEDSTDLKFTNPTDSWLMISAKTDGGRLVVDIWGADTGYEIDYSEPDVWVAYDAPTDEIVMVDDQLPVGTLSRQEPLDGLGVSITRTVKDSDGDVVLQDTWQTTYYATGPIIRVSPDMEDEAFASAGP